MRKHLLPTALLNWQILLLFAALGTLFPFYGLWTALAGLLLGLLCLPKWRAFLQSTPCAKATKTAALGTVCPASPQLSRAAALIIVIFLCFGLGAALAARDLPKQPEALSALPDWLSLKQAYTITAKIERVEGLPDYRLRFVLSQVQILPDFTANNSDLTTFEADQTELTETTRYPPEPFTLPGKLVWTWQDAYSYPFAPSGLLLPGQKIQARLRLRPTQGLENVDTLNTADYWAEQGVFWRAFSKGNKAEVEILSPAPFWQRARLAVQAKLLQALSPEITPEFKAQVTPASGPVGISGYGPSVPEATSPYSTLQTAPPQLTQLPEPNQPAQLDQLAQTPQMLSLSPGKAVLLALLMGNKYFLTQQELDLFAAASLSHSLALSGLHLGLMAAIGTAIAFGLCRLFPALMLRLPRPKLAVLLAAPLVLLYLWLGGLTPSLSRAALMFACWGILLLRNRPHVLMDGLLWAILILLLINPLALHDLRLQLSALSVAAIATAMPVSLAAAKHVSSRLLKQGSRAVKFLNAALSLLFISTAIQLALLPLQIWNFGQLTPFFVLNVIWLPLLSLFVFPLAVLGLLLSLLPGASWLAVTTLNAAAIPVNAFFNLLTCLNNENLLLTPLAARPYPAMNLAYWAGLLLLLLLLNKLASKPHWGPTSTNQTGQTGKTSTQLLGAIPALRRRCRQIAANIATAPRWVLPAPLALVLLSAVLLSGFSLFKRWQAEHLPGPRLTVLDVGQGQSLLLEGTAGQRILIDGGGFGSGSFDVGRAVVAKILTANRAPRLNAVINTHPDADHLAGLLYIIKHFEMEQLYLPADEPKGTNAEKLAQILEQRGLYQPGQTVLLPPLAAGDRLNLDQAHYLEVLHPPALRSAQTDPAAKRQKLKDNDASLVVRLLAQGESSAPPLPLLLTAGDAGNPALNYLLRQSKPLTAAQKKEGHAKPRPLEAQVLILPHHGSKGSYNPAFYRAVAPQLAIASAGAYNQWSFPVKEVQQELARQGIALYSTSWHGQIVINWNQNSQPEILLTRP